MTASQLSPKTVFHIVDCAGDLELGQLAIEDCGGTPAEHFGIRDPSQAIRVLGERAVLGVPPPALVLLDINMPRISGWEVLRFIKSEPRLRGIPVIILSSSNAPVDVARARAEGVEYRVKPASYGELKDLMCEMLTKRLPDVERDPPA